MASDVALAGSVILKVLSGVQSGVEVSLSLGDYSIGSGPDDDVHLIDVSLKPGHARLRVSAGKIEIAGGKGSVRTPVGVAEAGGEFQTVEPLDILGLGTIRLALGPRSANWASIGDAPDEEAPDTAARTARDPGTERPAARIGSRLAVPILAVLLVLCFAAWQVAGGTLGPNVLRFTPRDDLQLVRQALDEFPFGREVEARQEVDGVVFVNGYVDTPVERRALAAAVEKTGAPARVRLAVLQTVRGEVEQLIASQKVSVTPEVSPKGELTLDGVILNEGAANRFSDLVHDRVIGLTKVTNRVRTASTLLADVERSAQAAQIQPWVLLRVDRDLIEANGAVPIEKIDAWVGFLQIYARRFARDIPLRSFVQLQNAAGRTIEGGQAIVLGGEAGSGSALDVERLKQGNFRLSDVFSGAPATPPPALGPRSGAAEPGDGNGGGGGPGAGGIAARSFEGRPGPAQRVAQGGPPGGAAAGGAATGGAAPGGGAAASGTDEIAVPAVSPAAGAELSASGRNALEQLRSGLFPREGGLKRALDALTSANGSPDGKVPDWYVPLLTAGATGGGRASCWTGARLTSDDVIGTLFWLDLLSASEAVSITTLARDAQALLMEGALNPTRLEACARSKPAAAQAAANSLYLREIGRNPSFIRFITRAMPPFTLDVAGVSLASERYVITRAGRRLSEGAAPDRGSRIALVGELGVAVQLKAGLSAVVFGPEMSWKISQ